MGEPGGLPSMGSHRVGHDWSDLAAAAAVTCHLTGVCSFLTSITWTLGFNSDLWSCQLWNIPTLDRLRSYPWSFLICHTLLYLYILTCSIYLYIYTCSPGKWSLINNFFSVSWVYVLGQCVYLLSTWSYLSHLKIPLLLLLLSRFSRVWLCATP